ncbi:MAG: hypothetical protein ACYTG0_00430 [Planctomycetota bacterium]
MRPLSAIPYLESGQLEPGEICTSHVERNNLTIRHLVKRFTRLTVAFSKKLKNLAAAVALHFAYYDYCWRPRKPGKSRRLRVTPAMGAGVTGRLWRVRRARTPLLAGFFFSLAIDSKRYHYPRPLASLLAAC